MRKWPATPNARSRRTIQLDGSSNSTIRRFWPSRDPSIWLGVTPEAPSSSAISKQGCQPLSMILGRLKVAPGTSNSTSGRISTASVSKLSWSSCLAYCRQSATPTNKQVSARNAPTAVAGRPNGGILRIATPVRNMSRNPNNPMAAKSISRQPRLPRVANVARRASSLTI